MTLHNGSTRMAHHLDRFSTHADFEDVTAEAARLDVLPSTVRMYRDWYGEAPVTVTGQGGLSAMPAYEYEIRRQVHGHALRALRQLGLPFGNSRNHYRRETCG